MCHDAWCGQALAAIALWGPDAGRAAARAGLVPPAAALFLLGRGGAILMVIMLFMAVTSSGSAELVAVSSLFTYDIYRTYINPNATGTPPCGRAFLRALLHFLADCLQTPELQPCEELKVCKL